MKWLNLDNPVALWWIFLVSVTFLNLIFLIWLNLYRKTKKSYFTDKLFFLSSIYTIICAYRSVFPKADVQRIALFDTWLSSVFLGRTLATIAELAFVAQWALVLTSYSKSVKEKRALVLASFILPLITLAEVFSWYAVISTNYLGNTLEESLWALTYSLIFFCLMFLHKTLTPPLKLASKIASLGSFFYVLFMVLVDVPMYWNRYLADELVHKKYFSFMDGIIDLNTRWQVTYNISDWRSEIPWMSLYFSFAVWVSLALTFIPEPSGKKE